eukprot:CAMPEP_0197283674 /NCGR_PEP_ID=MMETSP1432-20130617/25052_1 /TAXON_ID=44447 /ORGANISM="Pseudo-nitzschia delicatissima, Strain UNC1205" /LENGTH=330 /DNA_ID=CAMNT_0042750667 /DNA_START=69 /DNA_END=1060 /DNA_ORIENTATION=-
MQSVNTRMRRAVEKENQDLDTKIGDRKKRKRRNIPRSKFNPFMALLVLSPLLILGTFIFVAKQYSIWSAAETELNYSTPQKVHRGKDGVVSPEAFPDEAPEWPNRKAKVHRGKDGVVSPEASLTRLRNGRIEKHTVTVHDIKASRKQEESKGKPKFLVLVTKHGNIKITLRPDLSQGSVDYIYKIVESYGGNGKRCMHCNFYRAEKPGIIQGIMANKEVVPVNSVRGSCPPGAASVKNNCPEWDEHCGCHGPVMTRGSVAWAAGDSGGPDFFIDAYPNPADWWGTQHTNFGFIEEPASMKIIDGIFELPANEENGMTYLKNNIHFDLVLE